MPRGLQLAPSPSGDPRAGVPGGALGIALAAELIVALAARSVP
jgi:hypothetical protein